VVVTLQVDVEVDVDDPDAKLEEKIIEAVETAVEGSNPDGITIGKKSYDILDWSVTLL
jgi:hypothetical protein